MIIPKKIRNSTLFSGLLPLFVLAHFAHHLLTALPVPLLPLIRENFSLDYTQAGIVVSVFSLSYGIGQLPAGWLADRIGTRILLTIGICGVAVAGLLVGLSQTYVMMIAFLILMGLVGGGYHPSASPLISSSIEPKNRGKALGYHLIGGGGSFFLSPLIAAAISSVWGWRGSFITLAIPTMIFGIIFYLLLSRKGKPTNTKPILISNTTNSVKISSNPMNLRRLIPFMFLTSFTQAVTFSIITFIPLFMVDQFSVSKETAAASISIIYFAGLWASPLGGYLSDRFGRVPILLASCLITGPTIYLLNLTSYGLASSALLLFLGIIMYIRMPTSESYIIGQSSEQRRSTILGIYYFANMEGGGLLTPLMGTFIDNLGYYTSFTIAGIAVVSMTFICGIFLWGKKDY